MIRKYVLPVLAVAGALFATLTVAAGSRPAPVAAPVAAPAQAPYDSYIAGAGIVESASQNIAIGSPLSRLAVEVAVAADAKVKAGDPLFRLDGRDLEASLSIRQAERQVAAARIAESEAALADAKNQVALAESLTDKRALSAEEFARRRF